VKMTDSQILSPITSLVDGQSIEHASGPIVRPLNPSDESDLRPWLAATPQIVSSAVDSAQRALERWSTTTPRARSERLLALASRLEEDAELLATIDSSNVGMPIAYARRTVEAAIDTFRFFAGAVRTSTAPAAGNYTGTDFSAVCRSPIGVVAAFLPWNVPTLMAAWKLAPAIAAGNTVIAKPSELTPYAAVHIARCASEVLPLGVVNVVLGTPDQVAGPLLDDERVRMVTLTGGTRAGRTVSERSAASVKRMHLELGGKGLAIVCEDADLDRAAAGIVRGALDNSGQDCTAASRVMVVKSVADSLIERLGAGLNSVRIATAQDEACELGPLITRERLERVSDLVRGLAATAKVFSPSTLLPQAGFFMAPVMAYDLPSNAPVHKEEIFGPVITVEVFPTLEELMLEVCKVKHRLGASVWTESASNSVKMVEALPVGKIWVNNHHVDALEMPHSGSWLSGYGVEQSIYALEAYQVLKTVYLWKG
jgi:aminobutyraldehyde dehydrogenase